MFPNVRTGKPDEDVSEATNSWLRAIAVAALVAVTVAVGVARMYRGMHHLTDVVAGAVLGGLSVLVCVCGSCDGLSGSMTDMVAGIRRVPR